MPGKLLIPSVPLVYKVQLYFHLELVKSPFFLIIKLKLEALQVTKRSARRAYQMYNMCLPNHEKYTKHCN